jgi:hypothetical protein
MSTTDQEQVTPTGEAKLSRDEVKALREQKNQLSTSIRQTVLDPKAKLPEEGSAQQLRSEHVQLTEQAETAKQQTERLTEAKLQVEPLAQECQGLEKELAAARESLSEFYQPLGAAAFAAQLAGQVKDVSVLANRLALHEKVTQLRQESEALTPSADTKLLGKAKAKAQQLAIAGKIKIEETKISKLDKQIGQQLLGEQQEETVRCEGTSAIVDQISERRAKISEKEGKVAESTAAFASSRDELTKKLALSPFETVADLNTQIKESNQLAGQAQKQLALLERELPDRLLADEELRSSDSELGRQVQELAEIQAQLKTAAPSLAGMLEKATSSGSSLEGILGKVKAATLDRKHGPAIIGASLLGFTILLGLLVFFADQSGTSSSQSQSSSADNRRASYANIDENGHYKSQSASSKGTLNSFNDHPRPVLDAVRDGKQVLELQGMGVLTGSGLQSNNYLILENGKLIGWVEKAIWTDKAAASLIGAKQGEVSWTIRRTLKTDESQNKITFEFTKAPLGLEGDATDGVEVILENEFHLRILLQMPDRKTYKSRNVREVQIVMDPEVGEGYWKGSSTTTIKFRGTVADVSDSVDRETGRGAVIPVTLP